MICKKMTRSEYRDMLSKDRVRYGNESHIKLYFCNVGYRIVTRFRRCNFLRTHRFLFPLYMLARLHYNRTCVKYSCDIPSHVQIGAGLKIDHPCGIVINSQAIIGENFNIKSGAVIGKNQKGVAVIGDNVSVGVHALIIGPICIHNNAEIGSGAIVTHDVPENAVVVCDSAHILRIKKEEFKVL